MRGKMVSKLSMNNVTKNFCRWFASSSGNTNVVTGRVASPMNSTTWIRHAAFAECENY